MFAKSTLKTTVIGSCVFAASAVSALAQGVNNPGALPMNFPLQTPGGWVVDDGNPNGTGPGPVPVSLNPSPGAPVWNKNFTGPNGGPFSYPANSPPIPVQEFLQVAPTLPWGDWHEEVATPGWVWAGPVSVLVNGNPISPTINGVGTSQLDFYFSPALNVGDNVIIRKALAYPGVNGAVFNGSLAIHEYPTPEPASLLLLAGGTVLMLKRRARLVA